MTSLPDELLEKIFRLFRNHPKFLRRIAKTCRRFRLIVEPIIYKRIGLVSSKTIVLFLRSTIQNPRLPLHVRYAKISLPEPAPKMQLEPWRDGLVLINQYINAKLSGDSVVAENLRQIICKDWNERPIVNGYETNNHPQETAWLLPGVELASIVLLLKSLLNLQVLGLYTPIRPGILEVLKSCPGKPLIHGLHPDKAFLPKLRKVDRMEWCLDCTELSLLPECTFWMMHPNITSAVFRLAMESPTMKHAEPRGFRTYHGQSNVRHLEIRGSMKWLLMSQVIKMPANLMSLECEDLSPPGVFDLFPEGWLSRSFTRNLSFHAQTLQRLSIQFVEWPPFCHGVVDFTFGQALHGLPNLQQLLAPIDVFLGQDPTRRAILSDCLPPSLLDLYIWVQDKSPVINSRRDYLWDDEACLNALLIGLEKITLQCPSIETVCCDCFEKEETFDRLLSQISDPALEKILSN
ncbi:hypothetical protein CPB86DRAFT_591699 [Serendipita vermifera]|nr:hypothetical protein CPB86DRAFT_591699 [Serendipita vermifera]